jgi:hypothetical protein
VLSWAFSEGLSHKNFVFFERHVKGSKSFIDILRLTERGQRV